MMSTDRESDIESLADALNGGASGDAASTDSAASGGAVSGGDGVTASAVTSATASNGATTAAPAHDQPADDNHGLNKTVKMVLTIILVLLLVIGGVVVGANWSRWFGGGDTQSSAELDPNAEDYTGKKDTYEGKKNTDSIAIPGFGSLNFQAGTTEQQVNFYNPEENTCYFKMSLYLPDGTKLWESQLVEPGKAVYTITLNQVVPKGTYEDAVLKYECFSLTDQSQLNGSEVKFTLNVID